MQTNKMIKLILFISLLSMGQLTHANKGAGATLRITTAQGEQLDLYKHSYALLIEVSDYKNGWASLPSIPRELNAVETELKAQGFHVTRISNPNERELKKAFDDFIDDYGHDEHNRLLFFYSGHGYSFPNKDKGYLVPVDAPNPNDDRKGFLRKALSMDNILTWARTITAKHALFLFDSCFSGSVFQSKGLLDVPPYISQLSAKPVRQFITAGSATDEVPAKSTFTPAFVDGLKYKLADMDKDGYITGMELGRYLQKVVPQSVRQMPQYGTIRDYELRMGDFIFVAGGEAKPPLPSALKKPARPSVTDPYIGMELVRIKQGCFQMGSLKGGSDERQHRACINQDFYMGKYEVTQAQWQQVMDGNPSEYKGDNKPVENVNWDDVQMFIKKLNQQTGLNYRLPTEAEWEYAARAGVAKERYWGDDANSACRYANGADQGLKRENNLWGTPHQCNDGYLRTAPVGQFRANLWGLYDMLGNVREWTCSVYEANYGGAENQCTGRNYAKDDPLVVRGGSSYSFPYGMRSAVRFGTIAVTSSGGIGFRLSRTISF